MIWLKQTDGEMTGRGVTFPKRNWVASISCQLEAEVTRQRNRLEEEAKESHFAKVARSGCNMDGWTASKVGDEEWILDLVCEIEGRLGELGTGLNGCVHHIGE